ncbi:hypothetical protein LAV84_06815 [Rhizobium sp. VS19-DR104.2]|uniref:hypothetical protein n=1 Tax=unclassified Rhizobium TaxID=2613769 RepID=UPI001CC6BDBC|nr:MULTISPECIES: hypothetical protein [unclassified Rhizobium]MBZ5760258.1 hypothetical protein [Rhizobium sp. VS19-DR96]MBZ5766898.1 hypothetical protein [Rhizobium sp. VS19-DR129.2]MBZ5773109.1 hypothetical protein [Rhizobium sp. VS19-DRK62.2]MBZ5784093.1 hypothetical protein [Rhizobium sp. VS19-DR121]MBZ5802453.1 hypothetical protein [Rhizobium sp. VS19-DR181]
MTDAGGDMAVGRAGLKLLYDVVRFKSAYPLCSQADQRIAPRLITSGLLIEDGDDRLLVSPTPLGRAFIHNLLSGDAA